MTQHLQLGEIAPSFVAPCIGGRREFCFDTMAGRHIVMLFYGSSSRPSCAEALETVERHRDLFDDMRASFFGVSVDVKDRDEKRVQQSLPGLRHFLDAERAISRKYGVMFPSPKGEVHRPCWMLFDPMLRLVNYWLLEEGEVVMAHLRALLDSGAPQLAAPVLMIPRVLEPDLCRRLIEYYQQGDPTDSGYMVQRDGKTVGVIDYGHKRRYDCHIEDSGLREIVAERIQRSIVPMIKRAYQFDATRIERWIVCCYDAEVGGYFRAHRDNTTSGTAHRKFACTINLNADEFEGGGLRFPEFGRTVYRPDTGGAVLFSCSLLHEALPVMQGRRYAFLPFFYDDAAAELRLSKNAELGDNVSHYRGGKAKVEEHSKEVEALS